ncbi:MAG: sigma-70 region 4 domain-containing protein [Saprospiraceae bacterium]|nr:sigma-70 region 4 domain-containing protein [Saprospiraceae bacterium]
MLVNMPVGYKTIFLLSVIDEYSHKEIGELLGITPETSRSQLLGL